MAIIDQDMQECVNQCLACYQICLSTAAGHCLEAGGRHAEPPHLRLMFACAELCRSSAHLMLLGSDDHRIACRACAEICERCAEDCERIGDMEICVLACRRCAESCGRMAI